MSFDDPNDPGNADKYHTGKECIIFGCKRPAGTHWGPHWCFEHNVERMNRITKFLESKVLESQKGKER